MEVFPRTQASSVSANPDFPHRAPYRNDTASALRWNAVRSERGYRKRVHKSVKLSHNAQRILHNILYELHPDTIPRPNMKGLQCIMFVILILLGSIFQPSLRRKCARFTEVFRIHVRSPMLYAYRDLCFLGLGTIRNTVLLPTSGGTYLPFIHRPSSTFVRLGKDTGTAG